MIRIVTLFALASVLAACANLPSGGRSNVRFVSEPVGATATTSLGQSCVTPCQMSISRLETFVVTFEKAGFQPRAIQVVSAEPRLAGSVGTEVGGVGVRFGLTNQSTMQDPTGQFRREHQPNPVVVQLQPLGR